MNRKVQALKYLFFDWLAAALSWSMFFYYRKTFVETRKFGVPVSVELDDNFLLGLLLVPMFWLLLYALTGSYRDVFRRSRLKEFFQILMISLAGVTVIFFALILDDEVIDHTTYYGSFGVLFGLHFSLTFLFRFIITSITAGRIHRRTIGYPSLMIGSDAKALELFEELEAQQRSSGNIFKGFIRIRERDSYPLADQMPLLGNVENIREVVQEHGIEEVIIALESSEHRSLEEILTLTDDLDVIVKVIPDMYDIIAGSVRMDSIYGTPLIQVTRHLMPPWQVTVKRMGDVVFSAAAMLILSPLYLFTMLMVRWSSKGPIFYAQERIGKGGRPFMMYKFRSMYVNAEKTGPALSSDNDPRITPWGRFMRKVRLDEIPQFYNVLKGDMSLVGPRPERQYFIDRIVEKAPHYRHLHKVRPGITSWGMVKYGYAESVEQMIRRMKYDLLYIENMSLLVDLKILIYTVQTVLMGRGK